MNFLLALFLYCFLNVQSSYAAIEVFAAGRHFDSFEDYRKTEKKADAQAAPMAAPVKKKQAFIPEPGQLKLTKASYNGGVHHVFVNFDQNWNNPKPRFIVDADELQYTLQEALEHQHQPALLISDSKKLRILSYTAQASEAKDLDKTIKQ